MSNPIIDLCNLYDLTHDEVLLMLRESVGDALGYTVISDAEINGKIVFYAEKDGDVQKIIRYSPLLEKRIKKSLEQKIDSLHMRKLKNENIEIIKGRILERSRQGLILTTSTGKAIAPYQLLIKEEEPFYQIGSTLDFHIHKISPSSLILDRRSKSLTVHTLKRLLPKGFVLYDINRKYGKRLKVYSKFLPKKEDLERIRMAFVEHIDFVMYDSADIEKILQNKEIIL
jgi:hypothetical protein